MEGATVASAARLVSHESGDGIECAVLHRESCGILRSLSRSVTETMLSIYHQIPEPQERESTPERSPKSPNLHEGDEGPENTRYLPHLLHVHCSSKTSPINEMEISHWWSGRSRRLFQLASLKTIRRHTRDSWRTTPTPEGSLSRNRKRSKGKEARSGAEYERDENE